MKITSQEEHGLRILIRIAGCKDKDGMSIPQLSEAENLSAHYVAKLARILRIGGFINSTPGYKGGYVLAKSARDININTVVKVLNGLDPDLPSPNVNAGSLRLCTNSAECSSRSLWEMMQFIVNQFLDQISLQDLVNPEAESSKLFHRLLAERHASYQQTPS